jgi:hypothetical protein
VNRTVRTSARNRDGARPAAIPALLKPETFAPHIARFNAMEEETIVNAIPNRRSWEWIQTNAPLFTCPDAQVEETYYYRWWTYRKHIKETPAGSVVTEFLPPVKHAGAHNTISCALGFHIAEGRWLRDQKFLDEYAQFWFRGKDGGPQPHFHKYSGWVQAALYDRSLVTGDPAFVIGLLDDCVVDYRKWEEERQTADGLFWQFDVRDGMEESISGSRTAKNARPTISSYMFANARAIAEIARQAGRTDLAQEYDRKAADLKRRVQERLWDPSAQFFKVRKESGELSDAREAIGFIPWQFEQWGKDREVAWKQFTDTAGFHAPYGLTTAERRHPKFRSHGIGTCEWDGAVWPFATAQTLTALANVLHDSPSAPVTVRDYFDAFLTYARSHRRDGKPYIGEYLDEITGHWIKGEERSRYYNHSTFADLLITGVVGLRPRADETIEVHPLLPNGVWEWFCLDGVPYHGRTLTILWDATGRRYGRGAGLHVLADGARVAGSPRLERITGKLPVSSRK